MTLLAHPNPARNWEDIFWLWAQPPSKTEAERCEVTIKAIRNAIARSNKLNKRQILVFTQGSYRNRVNIRQDSDVDVGVMLYQYFMPKYPEGKSAADFGNHRAGYAFSQFKNELEESLVAHFGRAAVTRGNKAFDIKANSYHVEADVVPLYEFRQYWDNGSYRAGVAVVPDRGRQIENYPERLVDYWPSTPLHYENGVSKNNATQRRFKGAARILKKIRNEMDKAGHAAAQPIPGYLLECLVWNTPNRCFNAGTWSDRVQDILSHIWTKTKEGATCKDWCEVDKIKYLFHVSQPWTRAQAHAFIEAAWTYAGFQ